MANIGLVSADPPDMSLLWANIQFISVILTRHTRIRFHPTNIISSLADSDPIWYGRYVPESTDSQTMLEMEGSENFAEFKTNYCINLVPYKIWNVCLFPTGLKFGEMYIPR